MNVVREINKINDQELQLGVKGSWHDEYKDSAYVFVGGLAYDLTEGDVITIMSQFGEVIDINMPRDKETGKTKGFSFLMYEDQRSTVLAVDNMNGAQVLGRTIRVDHCKKYEQRGTKNAEGDYVAPEEPTYNAMPPTLEGSSDESSSDSDADEVDEEDPMAAYLKQQKKAKKITDGKKRKRDGETKDDRRARKEDKRRRKEERDRKRKEREGKKSRRGNGDGEDRESNRKRNGSLDRDRTRESREPGPSTSRYPASRDDRAGPSRRDRDESPEAGWSRRRDDRGDGGYSRDEPSRRHARNDDGSQGRDDFRRHDNRDRQSDSRDRDQRDRSYKDEAYDRRSRDQEHGREGGDRYSRR